MLEGGGVGLERESRVRAMVEDWFNENAEFILPHGISDLKFKEKEEEEEEEGEEEEGDDDDDDEEEDNDDDEKEDERTRSYPYGSPSSSFSPISKSVGSGGGMHFLSSGGSPPPSSAFNRSGGGVERDHRHKSRKGGKLSSIRWKARFHVKSESSEGDDEEGRDKEKEKEKERDRGGAKTQNSHSGTKLKLPPLRSIFNSTPPALSPTVKPLGVKKSEVLIVCESAAQDDRNDHLFSSCVSFLLTDSYDLFQEKIEYKFGVGRVGSYYQPGGGGEGEGEGEGGKMVQVTCDDDVERLFELYKRQENPPPLQIAWGKAGARSRGESTESGEEREEEEEELSDWEEGE